MRVLKPPAAIPCCVDREEEKSVFLAGSIEMGQAEDWQSEVTRFFSTSANLNHASLASLTILNPRRDEWDASWRQSIDEPKFREQVEWELEAQERASVIAMYFAPSTKAPITLLELGLFARSGKVIVCCPEGYWRKGNIEVVCHRYGVPLVGDLSALCTALADRLSGPDTA